MGINEVIAILNNNYRLRHDWFRFRSKKLDSQEFELLVQRSLYNTNWANKLDQGTFNII